MADKYVGFDVNGKREEREGQVTSSGAPDGGKIPALGTDGKLDLTLFPAGIGDDALSIVASENLAANDLVNVWNDAGTPKVRKADATTTGKEAVGYVMAAVTLGNNAEVHFVGMITGLSGLTPGEEQFLSTTAGLMTTTVPSATGNVRQSVGHALSATSIMFSPQEATKRA